MELRLLRPGMEVSIKAAGAVGRRRRLPRRPATILNVGDHLSGTFIRYDDTGDTAWVRCHRITAPAIRGTVDTAQPLR